MLLTKAFRDFLVRTYEDRGQQTRAYVIATNTGGWVHDTINLLPCDNLNLIAQEILSEGEPYFRGPPGSMAVSIFRGFRKVDGPWELQFTLPPMTLQEVERLGEALEAVRIRLKGREFELFCQNEAYALVTETLSEIRSGVGSQSPDDAPPAPAA